MNQSECPQEIVRCDLDGNMCGIDGDDLLFALCRFICETRKWDGGEYPGQTLHQIILMAQAYLESRGCSLSYLKREADLIIRTWLWIVLCAKEVR